MKSITIERWMEAQEAERKQHIMSLNDGIAHYKSTYENYFNLVKLGFNLEGLSIMEVGPADFPALRYCTNYDLSKTAIVEPMPSKYLNEFIMGSGITLITKPMEDVEYDIVDEVWLFNVMQHIINPDLFVDKCKSIARRIRFFEPIDYPTCVYHPHKFSIDDFKKWFGTCVKYYKGGSISGFHQADCAFGTFIN